MIMVKLNEINFFPVILNMLEPDEEEFKTRVDWINKAIKSGFHVSHQEIFTHEHVLYLLVSLVKEHSNG